MVGPVGAGTSTLLRPVLRFQDPRSGRVLLDGADVRELDWESLRSAIGYVSQDVFLFRGSVADNIAHGRPDATDEQVRVAAAAEADDFVRRLAFGYDTLVGERASRRPAGSGSAWPWPWPWPSHPGLGRQDDLRDRSMPAAFPPSLTADNARPRARAARAAADL